MSNSKANYFDNGLRILSGDKVYRKCQRLLSPFGIITKKLSFFQTPMTLSADPIGVFDARVHYGKGTSVKQSQISSMCEAVERYYCKTKDQLILNKSYEELNIKSINPQEFILPRGTNYKKNLKINWVKAFSITSKKQTLVSEDLVYFIKNPQIKIFSSNGLSVGNSLEEAILHGIFEVIERDFHFIMEANNLCMPDVDFKTINSQKVKKLIADLNNKNIAIFIKYITNDIEIPGFGVFLMENQRGQSKYSYAPGVHLNKEIALTRAITEAIQLFPQVKEYSPWLRSKKIDSYIKKTKQKICFNRIKDFQSDSILENIKKLLLILKNKGMNVVVANLTKEETGFFVVRVLITQAQPATDSGLDNCCLSRRIFEVPVKLGYVKNKPKFKDLYLGSVCGWAGV